MTLEHRRSDSKAGDLLKIILAIIPPLSPIAVFLEVGLGKHFWINLILTILSFGLLGIIHALYIIVTR